MLEYEEKVRKSDFIQDMFQSKDCDDTINELVQQSVLAKFGYRYTRKDMENYQQAIKRFDRSKFPMFWIKYNIIDFPVFKTNEPFPKCKVFDVDKNELIFPDYFLSHKPLCVVASSDS